MTVNSDTIKLAPALLIGILIGAFYFGGLWWTIRKVVNNGLSPLWFAASLFSRTAITVIGFYLVSNGQWPRLIACLLGFIISRLLLTRRARAVYAP